jgi:hypothetical protein
VSSSVNVASKAEAASTLPETVFFSLNTGAPYVGDPKETAQIYYRCCNNNFIILISLFVKSLPVQVFLVEYNLRFDHRSCNAGIVQALDNFLTM